MTVGESGGNPEPGAQARRVPRHRPRARMQRSPPHRVCVSVWCWQLAARRPLVVVFSRPPCSLLLSSDSPRQHTSEYKQGTHSSQRLHPTHTSTPLRAPKTTPRVQARTRPSIPLTMSATTTETTPAAAGPAAASPVPEVEGHRVSSCTTCTATYEWLDPACTAHAMVLARAMAGPAHSGNGGKAGGKMGTCTDGITGLCR